ncbi:MAG: hypothetical protein ACSLFP_07070 [Acidimicrobiales bacterium]
MGDASGQGNDEHSDPDADLLQIVESARRLGVELDEADALGWLTAMAAGSEGSEVVVDIGSGAFGHRVSMLDLNPSQLARFREIGHLVEVPDRPGVVETALALSGSAAQSKVQAYPGDADFFERVNILAPTRDDACRILAELMCEKVRTSAGGPNHRFMDMRLGSYPCDVVRDGEAHKRGGSVVWTLTDIEAGAIEVALPDRTPTTLRLDDLALDPGWCKIDWIVGDPEHKRLANASNMLDVTWEAPDGSITPLDGHLDAYFQEVYLDAASIPLFSKLAQHVSEDALADYCDALEKEVHKYLGDPNYGKAARRMYNLFRMNGRYAEAAYIRELFDEPASMLYQVWSLMRTIDEAVDPTSPMDIQTAIDQADELVGAVEQAFDGDQEREVVDALLSLRDGIARRDRSERWEAEVDGARNRVSNLVNSFFHDRLKGLPAISEYMEQVAPSAGGTASA